MAFYNIIASKFEGLSVFFLYQNDEDDSAIDLTGMTAIITITGQDFSQVYNSSSDSEIVVTGVDGRIDLDLTPEQCQQVPCNSKYVMHLTDGINEPDVLLRGYFTVGE